MTRDPLNTPLCDLLGIRVPVVLAGMAGGPTSVALVAAVSRAGGLGTFGAMGMSTEALHDSVSQARASGADAVAVNVLLAPPRAGAGDGSAVKVAVAALAPEAIAADSPARPGATPGELVATAIAAGATAISVGLGDPAPVAGLVRQAGLPLIAMAACVEDAEQAVASGADVIVAQGGEAGGHRSNFVVEEDGSVPLVGTLALVPQIVDAVEVPVLAAGGIMDGRGLAASLALGAQGVQMGTRFLVADEASVAPSYKSRVARSRETESVITTAVSGRPARGLPNTLIRTLEAAGDGAGWPAQAALTAAARAAGAAADDDELIALWSGQAGGMAGEPRPAAEIMDDVVDGARRVLSHLGAAGR